jgi:multisubunit Na+/H+ antiporter MnhB subunit
MKWYEVLGLIVIWFLGLYLRGKFYESMRDYFYKDSWRTRGKK